VYEIPETRYTSFGDADLAYQVVGGGSPDLLYFVGANHLDLQWEHPVFAGFLWRLASLGRLITFDRRGIGLSTRTPPGVMPTWEDWADDVEAVLDAAGSERATIFAEAEAGPIALMFAATRPDRVDALILGNTTARFAEADDYPIGVSNESVGAIVETVGSGWTTDFFARVVYPQRANDAEFIRWLRRLARAALTPREAVAQYRYILESLDVRRALPMVQVPTLVLHADRTPFVPIEQGRYLADHIAGSRFVELPGDSLYFYGGDYAMALDEVAEFVTGERRFGDIDRVLTTVLFTDIVRSTEQAAALGDRSWRQLLDSHDRVIRDQLRRFRGREIKATGDGFCASFDGPARAIRCARGITESVRNLGVEVRAGLHTGECEVRGDDLAGLAVHIAARVGAVAGTGQVLVSSTVKDLVAGSGIEFEDRGEYELKGVPGAWKLFLVAS
jgi:class 3 adenylate cyclase/pimeloyl-ACP methyl ester carboxylesterase